MRDELIGLARATRAATGASGIPSASLPVELAQQTTGAGTTFLRWRKERPLGHGRGPRLWQAKLMASTATPASLADLHAIELQRITLNMQISLLHTLGRQAQACASKTAEAETPTCAGSRPRAGARVDRVGHPIRRRRGTGISTTKEIHHEHAFFGRRQHRLCAGVPGFPNGNDEPRRLLRLNVYFDNPVPDQGRRLRGPRRLLGAGGNLAPRRRTLEDLYQKGHARAGRRPHGRANPGRTTRISRARPGRSTRAASASCRSASVRGAQSPVGETGGDAAQAPPGCAEGAQAGSDPAWGSPVVRRPHVPRLSPGDSSINVHRLPRAPETSRLPARTIPGRTPSRPAVPSA